MAAISRSSIKLCGSHCGVSIGEDGPSQMALEDLAMFRAIPGATILYPSDAVSAERLTEEMARRAGICYLRTSRPKTAVLYGKDEKFPVPGLKVLRRSENDRVTVIGAGVTLYEALKASDQLKSRGIAIRVLDLYSHQAAGHRRAGRARSRHGRQTRHGGGSLPGRRLGRSGSDGADGRRRGAKGGAAPGRRSRAAFGKTGGVAGRLRHLGAQHCSSG